MNKGISLEKRFKFGENWYRFIAHMNEARISSAKESLSEMLSLPDLKRKSFLDVGSGSGLFSLAAHQLGADVTSFDYDGSSVASTTELKNRWADSANAWRIEQGSVLDSDYMKSLGKFDIVYSWGVLHHTGNMKKALSNVIGNVKHGGQLYIAIYNYQPFKTSYWKVVKKAYNQNILLCTMIVLVHMPYFFILRGIVRFFRGKLKLERGMSLWYDMLDWLGGYPFEAARPEEIIDYYLLHDFVLQKLTTCGGRSGCNEFVFRRLINQ